jgi:hypothetical protein
MSGSNSYPYIQKQFTNGDKKRMNQLWERDNTETNSIEHYKIIYDIRVINGYVMYKEIGEKIIASIPKPTKKRFADWRFSETIPAPPRLHRTESVFPKYTGDDEIDDSDDYGDDFSDDSDDIFYNDTYPYYLDKENHIPPPLLR